MRGRDHDVSGHALEVLELEGVLEYVAGRASSEPGRRRVLSLRPRFGASAVRAELERVGATMRFLEEAPQWYLGAVPDVAAELAQISAQGAVLDPEGIYRVGQLLTTSRLLRKELEARDVDEALIAIRDALIARKDLEDSVARCVDEEGHVLSSASRELKRIRDRLRGAHARIVKRLEAYLRSLSDRYVVPDASVTIREGRYVVPVRREGKGEVGGIVHDESQTGATLYVEPPVAIELMNDLRDLEREEGREIRRVLGELTALLGGVREELRYALDALADFDALAARARAARSWEASVPEVGEGAGDLSIREGRHPLLLARSEPVVPFDLELVDGERCLVISGPNTGGKSVLLKSVGLISALAQSGVVPPVGPKTRLPLFTAFFADIGDEQSIAQSLSTFSAHLANLADIVTAADERSLVLIDEMGTGTDPAEGAALARAVIEALVGRGATTLVTSHLGELKQLDADGSGIVNASLQFDADRMEPTYRLVKGRPGRSYGLAIARRLGFPADVLDRADALREAGAADLEDLLTRLQEQEQRAETLVHELDMARARTERKGREVEERASALAESERSAESRARRDARKMLMEARTEVEQAIEELRASVEAGGDLDEAASEARRRVEAAAARHRTRREGDRPGPEDGVPAEVSVGDTVVMRATGARGSVAELRGDRAVVEVGAMRLEAPLRELRPVDRPADEGPKRAGGWSGPASDGPVRTEIDLRGLRVDEVSLELQRALDEAVIEDLSELRIIHGKGTGALRQKVDELLSSDRRVRRHRMGVPAEGGAGVTIADLRGAS